MLINSIILYFTNKNKITKLDNIINKEILLFYFEKRKYIRNNIENNINELPNIKTILLNIFNEKIKAGLKTDYETTEKIAYLIADRNEEILKWIINYWIKENGKVPNDKFGESKLSYFSFSERSIDNILNLLEYAFSNQNEITQRRKIIVNIAFSWLYNSSVTKEGCNKIEDFIKEKTDKNILLKCYIDYREYLKKLYKKVFPPETN